LLFSLKITLNTNLYDILSHVYINDFYLNNYYFLWTQFFLLPTLLLYIVYYYSTLFMKLKNVYSILCITVLLFIMSWWVFEYYLTNKYCYGLLNIPYSYNNLLYNPLNKYHPIMFFISYIYVYHILMYINLFQNNRNIYYINYVTFIMYKNATLKLNVYWLLILISLYFGSWWAIQEGSWGGWWNWDSSEVFGLLILTFFLSLTHLYYTQISYTQSIILCYIWSIAILFIYIVLQMSYTLVSHNFGLSILDYGYVNTTFLCIFNLLIIFYLFSNYIIYKNLIHSQLLMHYNLPYKLSLRKKYLSSYVLSFLVIYVYVLSFNPIINNIFWTSLNIEILNKWFSWVNPKLVLLILIYILFWSHNSFLVFMYFVTYIPYFINYSPVIIYNVLKNIKVTVFHLLLLITFVTSVQLNSSVFVVWDHFYNVGTEYFITKNRSPYINNILVDNPYIIDTMFTLSSEYVINVVNSFFWFNTNLVNQLFLIDLSDETLRQVIINHTFMYSFRVYVYDIASGVTDLLVVPVLLLTFRFITLKTLIIF